MLTDRVRMSVYCMIGVLNGVKEKDRSCGLNDC